MVLYQGLIVHRVAAMTLNTRPATSSQVVDGTRRGAGVGNSA